MVQSSGNLELLFFVRKAKHIIDAYFLPDKSQSNIIYQHSIDIREDKGQYFLGWCQNHNVALDETCFDESLNEHFEGYLNQVTLQKKVTESDVDLLLCQLIVNREHKKREVVKNCFRRAKIASFLS